MNGTKFYKLGKSNELLNITVREEFEKLEESISTKITSSLLTVAEIVFSAILTLCFDKNINFLGIFPLLDQTSYFNQILMTVVPCSIVFFATIFLIRLIVKGFSWLCSMFKDNKKRCNDISALKQYFYQKVLNEITMALSLEKKAYELIGQPGAESPTVQEQNLSTIYLYEAVYYFQEACASMTGKRMFEISNLNRNEYTSFLSELNPISICQIFDMCIASLDRIKEIASETNESVKIDIENVRRIYSNQKENIKKQMQSN